MAKPTRKNVPQTVVSPVQCLEFLLLDERGNRTEKALYIPFSYMWMEGPNDMHVQFDGVGSDNFWPKVDKDEYYIIPALDGSGVVRAYHLGVRMVDDILLGAGTRGLVDVVYVRRVQALWGSPNR